MQVVTLEIPQLGNRCHLVHDGHDALVIDPPRDLRAVEAAAESHGVTIRAVADTHVHNDYISGAPGLARRHRADYLLAADEPVTFGRHGVRGGDVVRVGRLDVRVLDTPGHSRFHQAFHVTSVDSPGPGAVFTGGSLLDGTVGRTDLLHPRLTRSLAASQWSSARALGVLNPATTLHPTHGFGSFCAGGAPAQGEGRRQATVGSQLHRNPALTTERDAFVEALVAGFGPVPGYYEKMAPRNRVGAGAALPRPARPVDRRALHAALDRGAWVVDLRDREAFARGHLPGSISVEQSSRLATYVGWLVPWEHELVLVTDRAATLASAVDDLAAIGIDGVGTHVLSVGEPLTAGFRRTDWTGFREHDPARPRVLIDVRQRDEHDAGHLPGAVNLPVQDVEAGAATLPPGEVWVHCRSGYRAGIAASLLKRLGREVVLVDDQWDRVGELAIPVAA